MSDRVKIRSPKHRTAISELSPLVFSLIVSIALLAFVTPPAHASDAPLLATSLPQQDLAHDVSAQPQTCAPTPSRTASISPMCGCGTCTPWTIQGVVSSYEDGSRLAGITVYLITNHLNYQEETTTDSTGHFVFNGLAYPCSKNAPCIYPYTGYFVSVNGQIGDTNQPDYLGLGVDNIYWGQWAGVVQTDSNAYGWAAVYIEPARPVGVPYAALYSNTQYTTSLIYSHGTQTGFSHSVTFSVDAGSAGVSLGFENTDQKSTGNGYGVQGVNAYYISMPSYTATYYCNGGGTSLSGYSCGSQGIAASGITGQQPGAHLQYYATQEYLSPQGVQSPNLPNGGIWTGWYSESSSWKVGGGPSISYTDFGVTIKLDVSVSVSGGQTDAVSFQVTNTSPNMLTFEAYTAGQAYDPTQNKGGMEAHIWCISQTGCS